MTKSKEQLQAEYQTECSYLGDAYWKMKGLQSFISKTESKLQELEKQFETLPKDEAKPADIITHDDPAVNQ